MGEQGQARQGNELHQENPRLGAVDDIGLVVESVAVVVEPRQGSQKGPARPVGVLLFCGPTGVGKTALARALSRFFFGNGADDAEQGCDSEATPDSERLVRLDMSEYAGPGAAERLLGSPDGEPSDLVKRLKAAVLEPEQPLFVSDELKQTTRVMVKDENFCIHCGLCAERCPTAAWDMQKSLLSFPQAVDYDGGNDIGERPCQQRKAG